MCKVALKHNYYLSPNYTNDIFKQKKNLSKYCKKVEFITELNADFFSFKFMRN